MSGQHGRSFLFPPRAFLGPVDLRRIVQTAVFLADSVWLPATAQIDPALPHAHRAEIARRFAELAAIGAVRTWDVEDQAAFIVERTGGELLFAHADIVFPLERYRELHETLVRRLVEGRAHFLGAAAASSFDGVTEIVLGKETLGTFAMRELTGCDDILLEPFMAATVKGFMNPILERSRLVEGVVEEIQIRLSLPDLSSLRAEEIIECRQLMPSFRDDLLTYVEQASPLSSGDDLRYSVIAQLIRRFRDEIEHVTAASTSVPAQKSSGGWSMGRLEFPRDALERVARAFFGYSTSPQPTVPPGMLLLRLKQIGAQLSD